MDPAEIPAEIPVRSALYDLLPGRHFTITPTTIPAPWVQPLRDFVASLPQSEKRVAKDAEYFCIERIGRVSYVVPDHLYVSEVHPEFNPYRYSVEELEAAWDPDDCWFMDRWPCRLPAAKLLEEATRLATRYYPFPKWVAWCDTSDGRGYDSCCVDRHTTEQYADRCATAAGSAGLEYVLERYIYPNPRFFLHDWNPLNALRITRRAAPWWCRTLRQLIRKYSPPPLC